MAFSMTNVLNAIVDATTRTPHAVQLSEEQDLYAHRPMGRPDLMDMMGPSTVLPASAAKSDKTGEEQEHDTLARIRDALYRDQQA